MLALGGMSSTGGGWGVGCNCGAAPQRTNHVSKAGPLSVLVTGATGYIGGRLVPRLLELGHRVRVLVRDPGRVVGRAWENEVEIVQGDLCRAETLEGVFDGIEVAYYLVHSMEAGRDFAARDRLAATNFCSMAGDVAHVVYIGGHVPRRAPRGGERGSEHLRSRAEIGRILARDLPTSELRAGPIIGSGSASFEMVRYSTERLPVVVAPSWASNEVQPIAIRDMLQYLVLLLDRGPSGVIEVGAERLSYAQMMRDYASVRGLKRWLVTLPSPVPRWLGAAWMGVATPITSALARPLIEGMAQPLRARLYRARRRFPEVQPVPYKEAVRLALVRIRERGIETRWSDAGGAGSTSGEYSFDDREGMMREVRSRYVDAKPADVLRVCTGLGGARGWLAWNWVWKVRGFVDLLVGGPGLARGRRNANDLLIGEAVDFWRVVALQRPDLLRLRAEAKLPGSAWLEWRTVREGTGTRLTQTLAFAPKGLFGALYWYAFYPLHRPTFDALVRGIAARAEQPEGSADTLRPEPALSAVPTLAPRAPRPTRGLLGDIRSFVLHSPPIRTRIEFSSDAEREDYSKRILQRLGRDVSGYSVLNLHRIGVNAPGRYVFEELLGWDGDSTCWPNHIATIERDGEDLQHLQVRLLGKGRGKGWPLFDMKLVEQRSVPSAWDPDNGRYLLFRCEGGYPIGIFAFYVRSSIAERGEEGATQVFCGVSFDFYGKERWPLFHPANRIWETVHDRVMRNQLNRFQQLCEWKFERLRTGG